MKRVLFVGFDPATVDFSDPALPPGMTAEKIHAGVELALADFAAQGWHAQNCFVNPDETAVATVERCLSSHAYDCVVIGTGLRLPPGSESAFILPITIPRCFFTVISQMPSSPPTCLFNSPETTNAIT